MERTLIILKPDAVQRRLVGEILGRFEAKGLKIAALKLQMAPRDVAERHYAVHSERPFFGGLISFITSSPVVVAVLEGPEAIKIVRKLVGATKVLEAEPGTIRGDLGLSTQNNLVHASDAPETAAAEIANWFRPEELVSYDIAGWDWLCPS
jgi:nucleoside-diphosphate kinase